MDEMPGALRVSLWNIIEPWIWEQHYGDEYVRRARWVYNFPAIQWPTDEVPLVNTSVATQRLKQWLTTTAIWHQVYDFVEALPEMIAYGMRSRLDDLNELKARSINMYDHVVRLIDNYSADLNAMLEREGARGRNALDVGQQKARKRQADQSTPRFDVQVAQMDMLGRQGRQSRRQLADHLDAIL